MALGLTPALVSDRWSERRGGGTIVGWDGGDVGCRA